MRFPGMIHQVSSEPGITTHDHNFTPEQVIEIVKYLGQYKCVADSFSVPLANGVINIQQDETTWILNMKYVGPDSFIKFYNTFADKTIFAPLIRQQRMDTLISFLQDNGVKNISTLDKGDIISLIVKNPRSLYHAISGTTTGIDRIKPQTGSSANIAVVPLADGSDACFRMFSAVNVPSAKIDFWQMLWTTRDPETHRHTENVVKITTRSSAAEIAHIPNDANLVLAIDQMSVPVLELSEPTIDLASKKISEISSQLSVSATSSRQEMLNKVLVHFRNQTYAKSQAGKRLYFSFDGPIAIGTHLTPEQLLSLGKFVKVVGSGKNGKSGQLIECQIDPEAERTDFEHYFKARPKVWAVIADINLDDE